MFIIQVELAKLRKQNLNILFRASGYGVRREKKKHICF